MEKLIEDIQLFLNTYAAISPNWDGIDPDEKYTGPDPSEFAWQIKLLKGGRTLNEINSSWESGCYKPYNSVEGREMHDSLLKRIRAL